MGKICHKVKNIGLKFTKKYRIEDKKCNNFSMSRKFNDER